MSEGTGCGHGVLCDGVEDLEHQTQWTWYKTPRWLFRGSKMNPFEKAVLQAILDFWATLGCPTDWFYAPIRILTRWAGVSKPTMLKARKGLVKKCLIDFRAAPPKLAARFHVASEYKIPIDTIERLIKLRKLPTPLNTTTSSWCKSSLLAPDDGAKGASKSPLLAPRERLGSDVP